MVGLSKLTDRDEIEELRQIIARHGDATKSTRAWKILAGWDKFAPKFVKVLPKDYARVQAALQRAKAAGLTGEEAAAAAFEENVKDVARVGGN
jgi:glutamate synthase (ferredoxin)